MAKWTQYYKIVDPTTTATSVQDSQDLSGGSMYASHSWYQRLVQGSSTRLTRYREYESMDDDVDVARALDTIAEEMTNMADDTGLPLSIDMQNGDDPVKESLVITLRQALRHWCNLHQWDSRMFKVARNTIKYGDCFFIKSSKSSKWEYTHPKNVLAAIVDEDDVTKIIAFQVRTNTRAAQSNNGGFTVNNKGHDSELIPAERMVAFSLNDDMSDSAPFGESILKSVYRSHKQKALLEDAIIIYRVSRAPERRVFYIDVGKMPPQRVKQYLNQIKNEIKQKKIPTGNGQDGGNQVESVYNPHSMQEDFYFAQRADGKGSRVETLPGGQGLGELTDLEYFQDKVYEGLRVPTSYMKSGRDQNPIFNDGRVGQAYVEELRFMFFVERLQRYVQRVIDFEFKTYLREHGVKIDPSLYKIALPEGQNFAKYRQQEVDSALLTTMSNAESITSISKRFALSRFMQMTEEEIVANEKKLREERGIAENDPELMQKLYGGSADAAAGGLGGSGLGGGAGGLEMTADIGDDLGEDTPDLSADSPSSTMPNIPDNPQSNK